MAGRLRNILKPGAPWFIWSGLLALLTFVGVVFFGLVWNRPPDPVPVSVVTVGRDTVESSISESGTVELRGQVTLRSPIEGAIDQVFVKPRDRVPAGKTLMTLRFPERQTALPDQQLQIQRQAVALARNRQRVEEAQVQLKLAQQRLERLRSLAAAGAISQQAFEEQEQQVRTAQTQLRDAQADVRTATIELERLKVERQQILQQLDNSVITAPMAAVVLDVKVNSGDGVQFRTELLTLGDPTQEFIQLQLSTLNAARIQLNQIARVTVIGPDPTVYAGRVYNIYPQAVVPGNNESASNNQETQATVPAVVKLDRPSRKLIPGAPVNVEILLDQRQNVVTLPTQALQRTEDETFVWIRDRQGKAQKQPITTGMEGVLNIEVTQGLQPGEQVIIPPADPPLKPGVPVDVQ